MLPHVRRCLPVLFVLIVLAAPVTAAARPNVLVIETDDQTVADMAALPYVHNHGVQDVRGPFGGFERLDGSETLPVWLRRAGYSTALVGKYLNGYRGPAVPPGWTEFHGLPGGDTYRFYDYSLNENGVLRPFGTAQADYQSDVLTGRAEQLTQEAWRQRRAGLLAIDEGVARLFEALRAAGTLKDTLVIFTSDNGYLLGEHRVPSGKVLPYEPSIRVPLLMRGPGVPRGRVRRELVWNGDLAPTILDAAGARAPFALDGRSLLAPPQPRRDVVLEGPPARGTNGLPRFTGLRTPRYTFVEYAGGARELYDLHEDPDQLDNRLRARPRLARRLGARLQALRGCRGVSCRAPGPAGPRP
jgi:arylsulfatase A-like enzyme